MGDVPHGDEPVVKTSQGIDVEAAAAEISRLLKEQEAADAAAAAEMGDIADKDAVTSEIEAALEAEAAKAKKLWIEQEEALQAAKAKQLRIEQEEAKAEQLRIEQEEARALEVERIKQEEAAALEAKRLAAAKAAASAEDATKVGLELGKLGLSAGLALGDVALSLSIGAGKALARKVDEFLEPEPEPEPVDIMAVLDQDHAEHEEQVGLVKGYLQKTVEGVHNLARLKVEEGKARLETEALSLKREIAAMPAKAASGARDKVAELRHEATDAIMAVPDRAAQEAKAALFSQQQAARDKLRLARQKKRSLAAEVNANNARFAEAARGVVPGLKPTPPPPPPPKKFFGLF